VDSGDERATEEEIHVMRSLPIEWQRLVSHDGDTCPRCAETGHEVEHAVSTLEQALRPLGITPHLTIVEIDETAFRTDPGASNRITIAGRTVEDWLGGQTGSSECCSVCGDSDCRTIDVDGTSYEAIPEALIVKAALQATTTLLDDRPAEATSCCSSN
jgi:hypothetical protein